MLTASQIKAEHTLCGVPKCACHPLSLWSSVPRLYRGEKSGTVFTTEDREHADLTGAAGNAASSVPSPKVRRFYSLVLCTSSTWELPLSRARVTVLWLRTPQPRLTQLKETASANGVIS